MKRLLAVCFAAFALVANATTLNPVQLLNPSGSTSGQVITSNGVSSAPTWQSLPATVTGLTAGTGISVSAATGNVTVSITTPVTVANGGTNAASASGTALDNITGFASTGFLTRTGAGTYAFQSTTNGITYANLAQAGANTVLANATGAPANLAAAAVPGCSTSASALNWTSGTGFGCNSAVNAATLNGATFAAPGAIGSTTPGSGTFTTISATGAITPSTTAGIVGTITANNANAGSVGEYVTATGTAVSLTSGTAANITSFSLTAGDWDVWGNIVFNPNPSTVLTQSVASISMTSATQSASPLIGIASANAPTGYNQSVTAPMQRINVSTTTTMYLVGTATFSTSTLTATGIIQARRVR